MHPCNQPTILGNCIANSSCISYHIGLQEMEIDNNNLIPSTYPTERILNKSVSKHSIRLNSWLDICLWSKVRPREAFNINSSTLETTQGTISVQSCKTNYLFMCTLILMVRIPFQDVPTDENIFHQSNTLHWRIVSDVPGNSNLSTNNQIIE